MTQAEAIRYEPCYGCSYSGFKKNYNLAGSINGPPMQESFSPFCYRINDYPEAPGFECPNKGDTVTRWGDETG